MEKEAPGLMGGAALDQIDVLERNVQRLQEDLAGGYRFAAQVAPELGVGEAEIRAQRHRAAGALRRAHEKALHDGLGLLREAVLVHAGKTTTGRLWICPSGSDQLVQLLRVERLQKDAFAAHLHCAALLFLANVAGDRPEHATLEG